MKPKLEVVKLTKDFEQGKGKYPTLQDIDISIAENEFVSIVGRSGCGKSTMLNLMMGLLAPTSGDILVDGKPVTGPGLDRGMVFQQGGLFPWLTAIKNIEFGPKNAGLPKEERRRLALSLIELVHLEGSEDKYPKELSGGMQQRVAIARALATNPEILLMDEPFGALDQLTRESMQRELLRIWESHKTTVVFVTHGIMEAIYLSDRVLVFGTHPGHIKQEFKIDLPRPRQPSSPRFMEHHDEIYQAIY
jgi:ABC-type nitrate/sulfonate/bicarbonate transport system ATPase subunit